MALAGAAAKSPPRPLPPPPPPPPFENPGAKGFASPAAVDAVFDDFLAAVVEVGMGVDRFDWDRDGVDGLNMERMRPASSRSNSSGPSQRRSDVDSGGELRPKSQSVLPW